MITHIGMRSGYDVGATPRRERALVARVCMAMTNITNRHKVRLAHQVGATPRRERAFAKVCVVSIGTKSPSYKTQSVAYLQQMLINVSKKQIIGCLHYFD